MKLKEVTKMKVHVKASHPALPDFDKVIDSIDLPVLMGELTHYNYDIEDELNLAEIEMNELEKRKEN
jgi:hypothetical protein